jgi:23S rRNA pseudouridine1911/1915/1917 synthase
LALVEGVPAQSDFTSTASISKEKTSAGGRKIDEGTAASTRFETLRSWENKSLIKVIPRSGRTNQIRLHLAHLNLPIVGDLGYKDPTYFENNPLTYPTDSLFLHAWKLSFDDPTTQKRLTFEAPPNKKWQPYI